MSLSTRSWIGAATALLIATGWVGGAVAMPYEEDLEDEDAMHIVRLVRDFHVVPKGQELDPRFAEADLTFVEQMARHHQGAVDMAETYLADPRGRNPVLRRLAGGIIANQRFEIDLLGNVRSNVAAGPRTVSQVGSSQVVALDRGIDGLEHVWKFRKASPPSIADIWLTPGFAVSDFDVQFVRPMVQHHQAAVQMAGDYNSDPVATNLLLRRLNNDIMVDQRYEIGFIESVLARYPGDPQGVPDDPRMMEIMHRSMGDMMMHAPGGGMEMPAH